MHHQTDTLHDSDYIQIFPTVVGIYKLQGYHPAEEPKVLKLKDVSIDQLSGDNILDSQSLLLLKQNINDCIKAYSNEFGADYYEIKDCWYERHHSDSSSKSFDSETFIGYYFVNAPVQQSNLILDAPFKSPIQVPKERSVSIYTAPNEKFIAEKGWLIITPAYLNRYFTVNEQNTLDMIVFTVKKCR